MLTETEKTKIRQAIIVTLKANGFERDAEAMEQELGNSTVAHMMTMVALEVVDIVKG